LCVLIVTKKRHSKNFLLRINLFTMAKKLIGISSLFFIMVFCAAFIGNDSVQKSDGGPPYNTNAPGEKTCSGAEGANSCHSGSIPDNSGPGTPSILFSGGTTYAPGQTYTITPTIFHPTRNRFGFQIVSLKDSNNAFVGTITLIDTNVTRQQQPNWGSYQDRIFVMHRVAGSYATGPNTGSWTYKWTAPSYNAGNISFYACFNAVNNNNINDAGDETYYTKITITPSAVGITEVPLDNVHVSIYPNPCTEYVYLYYSLIAGTSLKAELINMEGKFVQSLIEEKTVWGIYSEKIELREVPAGIYFIKSDIGGKENLQKIYIKK
jgi:hypothetical protein